MPPEPLPAPSDDLVRPAVGQRPAGPALELLAAPADPVRPLADSSAAPAASPPGPFPTPIRSVSRGTLWRALAATLMVGVLAGSGAAWIGRTLERTTAEGDRAALADVATAYLAAIAEGRAADANALVPPPTRHAALLSDLVLDDAARITEAEAVVAHLEGDRGWVDVHFRVGRVDVVRTLDAVREEGGWHLTTSLAEPAMPAWWLPGLARLSAAPLHEGTLLYPGVYTTDAFDDGVVGLAPTQLWIDGDPGTVAELVIEPVLRPEIEARLAETARRFVEGCRSSGECAVGAGSLEASAAADVDGFDGDGSVEVVMVVMRSDPPATVEAVRVGVRGDMLSDMDAAMCGLLDPELDTVLEWRRCRS